MNRDEPRSATILHELQERAKELNCLYRVDELLNRSDCSLEEIFRGDRRSSAAGMAVSARLPGAHHLSKSQAIRVARFSADQWVQSANIVVQGETVGTVEVSYRQQMPRSDEGPFLKEERKLIDTIADRIADHVLQRRLKAAFEGCRRRPMASAVTKGEWRVVLEFLRDTDPVLLQRISRKLVNHLSWNGVHEAKELLRRQRQFP